MKNFKVAQSDLTDTVAAVKSIKEQLSGIDACLVLYFASPSYPAAAISKEMAGAFVGVHTVGCTTAGEMGPDKMGQDSIVAMAWNKVTLKDLKIEVLENIQTDTEAVAKAFKSFEKSLGKPMKLLDPAQYVGMVMIDGLSGCEEAVNDRLGNLTNVPFVGGSTGDNFMFQHTYLFVDGKAFTNAAVLLLMEPSKGYAILKTQSFITTDKKLTPTKVDEKRRMVVEFNGKPAAEAYASVLGISVDDLAKNLGEYPLGLVFDEHNFFVRSPMKIEGTSIIFYCSVKEGLELTVLHSSDIVTGTRTDLAETEQNCGEVQAVVDFNCCLRVLELTRKNQLKAYSEIFRHIPTIGFATYGESYIGHINQTSTMLLLK
ncbi:MAG: FIST C-terminal domain-containing protein [Bacteroidales bacterium]|jgi:hypothetical protein|nr:FIST C-terminal domain-containing protein [Bacteroidales bacterium]